ncbi:MAG: ribonucleoside-diphosphate reductase, adenosylcobalamin-dependent [Candidatus Chisholmbacteria bacterium RIFCSPLOWO2_01_FULL_50_28]|uniref:Vitamin B12-dependent ribonucleotide reductase n=1 Tax=Candidatus Chisholmbacteria bacterium RIFCSPHIGHO2_01_FULL_52_32 TaxID=1797591 RepID=A0A1G1VS40_9BACT|nr:MAG: ribonucleoside-diphosphate reductase, adenosylcobalamin-dependent [Candidatus Chisholmbacteria bacterium RIFCSPHIGHO2_01_FULL_52_32]OGY20410.1 MAG: ribonucleoside-diphosphate reductase, adenosylcobalamin-dependent [Candidatus Chisholmbacteria bacterium RIFCSPLOWO2_01_FULL_50_28]
MIGFDVDIDGCAGFERSVIVVYEMALWQVRKRSGEPEDFDPAKITRSIVMAQSNVGVTDAETAKRIAKMAVSDLSDRLASERVIGTDEIGDTVERILIDESLYVIARAYIIARERRRQERKAEKQLGVVDDVGLPYNSVVVIRNKYLRKDDNGHPVETPKQMFLRVAQALARAESSRKGLYEKRFFDVMVSLRFLPGGRTLANAGTVNNQLANCFVLPMPDSVEGFFEVVKASSILKKNGGAVGFNFGKIRPKGDIVARTSGRACGPVALMKIVNDASDILLQAGGRRSGNMVILPVSHPDILEFITCKEDETLLPHINYSLGVTGKFMEAAAKDRSWNLINPRNGEVVNTVSARSILELACSMAWRNGDPGLVFLDRINVDNPTPQVGVLEAVNLCGEQPLLPWEACNLGSINLAAHLMGNGKRTVDWERLSESVRLGIRMLDDVVTVCGYPLRKIQEVVRSNRKIGLGVMGWADVLVRLGIPYTSEEALRLAHRTMKFIRETAEDESQRLGREKGSFPNFRGSVWEKRGFKHFRNATLLTIAPTGSISMAAGVSYGIEPLFALAFYKEAMGGVQLPEVNSDLMEALRNAGVEENGLLDEVAQTGTIQHLTKIPERIRRVFVTAHDLSIRDHVFMQAAFQKYTDNAVSKTINLPHTARVEDVEAAFVLAWKTGCKGITVYRDASRKVQVLHVGKYSIDTRHKTQDTRQGKKDVPVQAKKLQASKLLSSSSLECPQCGAMMQMAEGCATCPSCAFSVCSL